MPSNLPPGVTDNMIPGNRPEDHEYDDALIDATDAFSQTDLSPNEIRRAVKIGIAAIKAEREDIADLMEDSHINGYNECRMDKGAE
jgi:hypothetical protein